uniref:Putative ovule protein n=1 Tax=Solanum chacoense TaxID=4108 RepID=A0A0V0HAJ3_SOLCH
MLRIIKKFLLLDGFLIIRLHIIVLLYHRLNHYESLVVALQIINQTGIKYYVVVMACLFCIIIMSIYCGTRPQMNQYNFFILITMSQSVALSDWDMIRFVMIISIFKIDSIGGDDSRPPSKILALKSGS